MNRRIKFTIGIGAAILLLTALFATAAFAQGPVGGFGRGMMGSQGFGGMMGGYGGATNGFHGMMQGWSAGKATAGITPTMPFGSGMMGSFGGMMGAGSMFTGTAPADCPMFGGAAAPANAQPISFDRAVEAVQQYLQSYGNGDLALAEVMEFERNFYAVIKEQSSGRGAFELLVNRYTGYVSPEPGPNMMWNTKYGHMAGFGGMMGWWNRQVGPTPLTAEQARAAGQQWLDASFPGAVLADDEVPFYGYYTLDFLQNGEPAGMLSVNAYTGQVWYHNWHGAFIDEQEF